MSGEEFISDEIQTNKEQETNKETLCPHKSIKTKGYVLPRNALSLVKSDFDSFSREQLVDEVIRLQRHVTQLKNVLGKRDTDSNNDNKINKKKKFKERPFDQNKWNKRRVMLKFLYLGWDYNGYISQEHTVNTIEHHLFEALKMTKLIESRETSNYHRCGRTDNGVSAFSQVASIDVRSNCASGLGVIVNESSNVTNHDIENEINYIKYLNGALPDDIRVICWAPVGNETSARFDCTSRIYRYYFPKGDLNIDAINDAGKRMLGSHDFRNFCKMDVSNGVVTFFRNMRNVSCTVLGNENNKYSTVELIIESNSFLWHQIRCIVGLLFLVGQGKEEPSVITELLNVEKYPCKPQYSMSAEIPLVLFDCQYESIDDTWRYDHLELEKLIKTMQDQWVQQNTKATIAKRMIDHLEAKFEESKRTYTDDAKSIENRKDLNQTYLYLQGQSQGYTKKYTKLTERVASSSLEDRVNHFVKKRRLDSTVYDRVEHNKALADKFKLYKKESEIDNCETNQITPCEVKISEDNDKEMKI